MIKIWNYLFALIWFSYLLAAGVHLFSRGFLLSRQSQTKYSQCIHLNYCRDPNNPLCLFGSTASNLLKGSTDQNYCLPKKSKIILLVIDALKYDFGIYDPELKEPLPYQNKLPILHQLLTHHPNHARVIKFIADPPTTTLQRLKGLMTGTLPTFIDVGSNFATPEINEDNIIDQVIRNNMSTIFMGDSTWIELFPERFKRHKSFPSFNIFDLDTVDTEIKKYLPDEIKSNDWDLLITHFLGVDHCGHRYGPVHPEMARKLTEMNQLITDVVIGMDNDTTLLVIGDHGMTGTGDHGGDTIDELNALLFAYSKRDPFIGNDGHKEMYQIDLVPTLATILGIPIPFSNLGKINFNTIPKKQYSTDDDHIKLIHLWQNVKQINNYLNTYMSENHGTFDEMTISDISTTHRILSDRVSPNLVNSKDDYVRFVTDVQSYLRDVLQVCRNIWIKFDSSQMSHGMLIVSIVTIFIFLLVGTLSFRQLKSIFTSYTLIVIYLSNIFIGFGGWYFSGNMSIAPDHGALLFTCIFSMGLLAILIIQNWPDIATSLHGMSKFSNIITRGIYLFAISIYFSNSFIVQEQWILLYLLIGLVIIFLYEIVNTNFRFDQKLRFKWGNFLFSNFTKLLLFSVVAILTVRFSYPFFKCREEQGNCTEFTTNLLHTNNKMKQRIKNKNSDVIPVVALAIFVTFTRIFLRSCGNLTGFSSNVMLARYGPTIAAICTSGHFILAQTHFYGIQQVNVDALAWVVYILFVIQLLILLFDPLMIYVLPKQKNSVDIPASGNVVPMIFQTLKQIYEGNRQANDNEGIPIVYGLATVYSSTFLSFGTFLIILLALVLGPSAASGIFIALIVACTILVLSSVQRFETARMLDYCLQPTFLSLVTWHILANFSFYVTSHQPTLSQIDWHAAFVGRSANFDHSFYISAGLVLLNTFGGGMAFYILFPLLGLAPFCLYAMYPSLIPKDPKRTDKKSDLRKFVDQKLTSNDYYQFNFDVKRGELTLYENESSLIGSMFKIACQLFILQGFRIFLSMLACTIHCRHLMVWKIFAPRFIFEGITTYVTLISICFGFIIMCRLHKGVDRLITKITKMK